ncbi:DUF6470 family protein [Bacillus sp. FJAT-45066]|uniref:DUF6470 family protein n=1 Tax=Bacillus sp. FJAT-45066 TaxID=2011010 RepID=UPI000BB78D89|nr:DUF6470 family protein [Bacillus sp. FJAT-45066]
MNIPQLRINQTNVQIGLNIRQPVQEIKQPQAEMTIRQPEADMNFNKRPPRLTINQTKALADVGIKSAGMVVREAAQKGYGTWSQGMSRVARDGDELMRIEHGGNRMPSQAKRNGEPAAKEFNVGWIPSHFSVGIDYDPGDLDIQVKVNKPIIDVRPNKPIHNYTPGSTDVFIAQEPTIDIRFIDVRG